MVSFCPKPHSAIRNQWAAFTFISPFCMLTRMHSVNRRLALFCSLACLFLLLVGAGCSHIDSHLANPSPANTSSPAQNAKPTPQAKHITVEDLKKLRWIEGTWKGTGGGVGPFYERYRFETPATLLVEGLADEKVDKVTETSRFELKEGEFGSNSDQGSRSVATALDDNSITFDPVTKARNTFRFQKESPDSWKAILTWPANEKGPAGERIYNMERWPPVKR
jgi:hypothetical protein